MPLQNHGLLDFILTADWWSSLCRSRNKSQSFLQRSSVSSSSDRSVCAISYHIMLHSNKRNQILAAFSWRGGWWEGEDNGSICSAAVLRPVSHIILMLCVSVQDFFLSDETSCLQCVYQRRLMKSVSQPSLTFSLVFGGFLTPEGLDASTLAVEGTQTQTERGAVEVTSQAALRFSVNWWADGNQFHWKQTGRRVAAVWCLFWVLTWLILHHILVLFPVTSSIYK